MSQVEIIKQSKKKNSSLVASDNEDPTHKDEKKSGKRKKILNILSDNSDTEETKSEDIPTKEISKSKIAKKKKKDNKEEEEKPDLTNQTATKSKKKKEKREDQNLDDEDNNSRSSKSRSKSKTKKAASINLDNEYKAIYETAVNSANIVDEQELTIFKYILKLNKPMSQINIKEGLGMKKKGIDKALESLVNSKLVTMKEYNTKIYLINQDLFPKVDDAELSTLQESLYDLRKKIKIAETEKQRLLKEKEKGETIYNDDEKIEALICQMKENNKYKTDQLKIIKDLKVGRIPEEKMRRIITDYTTNLEQYKNMKRIANMLFDILSEAYDVSTRELFEYHGLENDSELKNKLLVQKLN